MSRRPALRHLRRLSGLAALPLLGLGCSLRGAGPPAEPPLLFVRHRGAWAPEDLHLDVAECIDASHGAVMSRDDLATGPPGVARRALRELVVGCMEERGWVTGSRVEPEEWVE